MKRIESIFIGLLLLGSSMSCSYFNSDETMIVPAVIVSFDELSHDHTGQYYYEDSLFSGYAITAYSEGDIKSIASYYGGKAEGDYVGFYQSGDTAFVRPYHFGEKHGTHLGYYRSGQKKFAYYFENGFNEGNHKEWFENGSLNKDMNYVNGKELGAQQVWRIDGKMKSNYVVKENGRKYGMLGLKRCSKIDSETQNVDPYTGILNK
ncbi:MAG: hypothetical protein OCD76_15450 [Reichenbachiella sp.]